MSLHLGNLSSRVRRDELERVFRRFGRCSIQVKDKFGFIVYDYPVNAERALKSLRGKKICGEQLTLSWSNRQPRPLPRAGGRKSSDSRLIRNSRKENYVNGKLSSDGRQDSRIGRVISPKDEPEDATNGDPDNAATTGMKAVSANGNGAPSENFLENNEWDQIDDIPNGNELKIGSEFDRYEPYSGDDKRDDDEFNDVVQIGKAKMDQVVTVKTQKGCYNCGELGHKMRNCPEERQSNKKLNRFDRRHNDKSNYNGHSEDELRKVESVSQGREQSSRDAATISSHNGRREASSYRKHHRLMRTDYSPADYGIHGSQGKEFESMKRIRESESPERHHARKSRRPQSSPILSDDKISRSTPHSKYSMSATRSKSRSGSKSHSSSRASLYVSTSSGQPSTPPTRMETGEKDSFIKASSPEQKKVEIKSAKLVEGDFGFDDPKLDTMMTVEKGTEVVLPQVDKVMDMDHIQKSEEETHLDEEIHLSDPLLEHSDFVDEIPSPISQQGTMDLQICDLNTSEHPPTRTHKSMRLTSEEMLMVIKHYGLKQPEGVDKDSPVESFFGSARLWPWEIIYYRRHKKGPVSTENYARRISQNKEFGIVDKYVRSSSGWGEMGEDDL